MIEKFERVIEPRQKKDFSEQIFSFMTIAVLLIMIAYFVYINFYYEKGELEFKEDRLTEEIDKNLK